MYKLVALYTQPADPAAFEKHYREVHRPLVERIPGLAKVVVNRGVEPPRGGAPAYYLMGEMHFADEAMFKAAMASPEMAAAGKDLRNFAPGIVTLVAVRED
ncbi:MAG TPA: EthD family reductase [Steroidobacter sp.]|jgi:uncharacterized protein (TIGR02118 family)|nr:EthD family reductase [Steroidobacter sp.]